MAGWISIHRKIVDNWVWKSKPFSKGQAWIDILLMVNHADKKVALGNELIEVKRGSRITSIRYLCERWGWSNTKVENFLKMLEKDGMLIAKSDAKKTTLTVVNYNDYQPKDDSKNDAETTRERQSSDTKTTQERTNNNDNNDNNENNENKNNIYSSEQNSDGLIPSKDEKAPKEGNKPHKEGKPKPLKFNENSLEMQLARHIRNGVLNVWPKAKVPPDTLAGLQTWASAVDRMFRLDHRTYEDTIGVFDWANQDDFWSTNILSPEKLRKQYDRLAMQRDKSKGPKRPKNKNIEFLRAEYKKELEKKDSDKNITSDDVFDV